MYKSFGYLTKAGYGGHVFPVVFGETGSFLTAVSSLPSGNPPRCFMTHPVHLNTRNQTRIRVHQRERA